MTIKSIKKKQRHKIEIDLTGPQGNAFVLLGIAQRLCGQIGKDYAEISTRMKSGNYDNLITVFEQEFGDFVDLYR